MIASSGIINIIGYVTANGGRGAKTVYYGGGGSGGAIRLLTNVIKGNGNITANGNSAGVLYYGGSGAPGRIRLEAYTFLRTTGTSPAAFTVQQTASNQMPLYTDGEKVLQIKVASAIGGKSSVFYITKSGREVPAGI